jgi:hypothetical protein
VNPRVGSRVWAGTIESAGAPTADGLGLWLFRRLVLLLDLFEVDLVAERFELALEPAGAMFGRVALALPVGSEFRNGTWSRTMW